MGAGGVFRRGWRNYWSSSNKSPWSAMISALSKQSVQLRNLIATRRTSFMLMARAASRRRRRSSAAEKIGGGVFSFAASAAPVARWAGRGLGGAGGAIRGFLVVLRLVFSATGAGAGAGVVSIGDGAGDLATRLTRRFFFRLNASVKPESEASERWTAVSLPVEGGVGLAARLLFDRERDRLEGVGDDAAGHRGSGGCGRGRGGVRGLKRVRGFARKLARRVRTGPRSGVRVAEWLFG
ncbi:hypothetical protein ACJJTC_011150 [Scirpophaga incertulas]